MKKTFFCEFETAADNNNSLLHTLNQLILAGLVKRAYSILPVNSCSCFARASRKYPPLPRRAVKQAIRIPTLKYRKETIYL